MPRRPTRFRALVVHYQDLDLSQPRDAQRLYRRIKTAARMVCDTPLLPTLRAKVVEHTCVDRAVTQAVGEVGSAQVTRVMRRRLNASRIGAKFFTCCFPERAARQAADTDASEPEELPECLPVTPGDFRSQSLYARFGRWYAGSAASDTASLSSSRCSATNRARKAQSTRRATS